MINASLVPPTPRLGSFVIEGEIGVGKTTLWQLAVDAAQALSYRLLACRPAEAEINIAGSSELRVGRVRRAGVS